MSSYTIDFSAYSLTEDGNEGTVNQHNLSTVFQGDYKFEDVSTVDTGGLTAWGAQIEAISTDDSNWTIVRLSHTGGNLFSLDDFEYSPEGAHTYKLVNPDGVEYEVSTANNDWGGGNDVNTSTLENSFSNVAYVDFYSRAITYLEMGEFETTQTKWHLDDIQVTDSGVAAPNNIMSDRDTLDTAVAAWITDEASATTTYGDINNWDVSAITDFSNLFEDSVTFNSDISGWDVSSGTDFSNMFDGASAFNQDLADWDVSSGTDFSYMFSNFNQDGYSFNGDISGWDVSSGTNFSAMFASAEAFDQDLSLWDVSSGTNFSSMFYDTSFNQDLNDWDVSSGTNFSSMFDINTSFNGDISSWDVSSGTTFTYMFYASRSLDQDLSSWDMGSATNLYGMFYAASNFNSDLSSWDVSNVTAFTYMFNDASTFDQNLSLWDVSSGTAFTDMFNATSMSNSQGINSTPNISYFDATTGNDTITGTVGVVADSLRGHNGNDKLKGLSGDDTIFGDAGNDKLYGGRGADTLTGGDDRDKLVGGKGADTLIGGEGKDRLNGGLGKDTLTGGSGKDIFYLSANTGKDTITDYGTGNDQLKLTGGLTESDLTIRQSGVDVRIKYDGDLMVIVQNTLADNLNFI